MWDRNFIIILYTKAECIEFSAHFEITVDQHNAMLDQQSSSTRVVVYYERESNSYTFYSPEDEAIRKCIKGKAYIMDDFFAYFDTIHSSHFGPGDLNQGLDIYTSLEAAKKSIRRNLMVGDIPVENIDANLLEIECQTITFEEVKNVYEHMLNLRDRLP